LEHREELVARVRGPDFEVEGEETGPLRTVFLEFLRVEYWPSQPSEPFDSVDREPLRPASRVVDDLAAEPFETLQGIAKSAPDSWPTNQRSTQTVLNQHLAAATDPAYEALRASVSRWATRWHLAAPWIEKARLVTVVE
jgi:hypothetical protein